MSKINKIVLHCSDSTWGSATVIDGWHKQRGWSGIGYHYVILNGKIRSRRMQTMANGLIETGRPLDDDGQIDRDEIGAHAYGINFKSIGVCLIGRKRFTKKQITSLMWLLDLLILKYNVKIPNIIGHYEHDSRKTCPNLDMPDIRLALEIRKDLSISHP